MFKRWLAFLLVAIMLLGVLASCDTPPTDTEQPSVTTDASNDPTETTGPSATPSDTGPVSTNPVEEEIVLRDNELLLSKFRLVYPAGLNSAFYKKVQNFSSSVLSKTGIDLVPTRDTDLPEEELAYEILIGDVSRSSTKQIQSDLRLDDYTVCYLEESRRIVILGGNNTTTQTAFQYFLEHCVDMERKTICLPQGGAYLNLARYALRSLDIDGTSIRDYRVVIPQNADLLTEAAAQNVVDLFTAKLGVPLPLVTDSETPTPFEILVGKTNRPESALSCELSDGEFVWLQSGTKLIFQGFSYMVGGAFGDFVREQLDLTQINLRVSLTDLPTSAEPEPYVFEDEYTNVILMIGDGMGYNQVEVAKANGLDRFVAELLPYQGSAITRSTSVIYGAADYTDSAAAATALATGYKTINGLVGLSPTGDNITNVRELAFRYGAQTAVVTTDSITGATPAGFLAHASDRNDNLKIMRQINTLIAAGMVDYCKGGVADQLLTHTRNALIEISDTSAPFFAMIEEAYVDKNCHNASMSGCIETVTRFNTAIAYAIAFTLCHPGTALIITADHETGGITKAGETADSIIAQVSQNVLNDSIRRRIKSDVKNYGYSFTSFTGSSSCQHTNADVPVYAIGPGTEIFHKTATENIDIARFMAKAYGAESFGQTDELPPRK